MKLRRLQQKAWKYLVRHYPHVCEEERAPLQQSAAAFIEAPEGTSELVLGRIQSFAELQQGMASPRSKPGATAEAAANANANGTPDASEDEADDAEAVGSGPMPTAPAADDTSGAVAATATGAGALLTRGASMAMPELSEGVVMQCLNLLPPRLSTGITTALHAQQSSNEVVEVRELV